VALIADIGGTNARFALLDVGTRAARDLRIYKSADHARISDALNAYLAEVDLGGDLVMGCFAVAAPILGDRVHFTNSPWTFSILELKAQLGVADLVVVNDFAALAYSVPQLGPGDVLAVGGGSAVTGAPVGIVGPGTGLGVSALVAGRDGAYVVLAAEGGHVTIAACDDREAAVLGYLRGKLGHVSAERVVSGPGLVNLYDALCHLGGVAPTLARPDQVTAAAQAGQCPVAVEALDMFFAMLGTVASNLALSLGAQGGIMLAGGILPKLADALTASRFRPRFEDKGRYGQWLGRVPTQLIVHPETAFLGLASLVARQSAQS
jgi:glucokinase